MIFPVSGLDLHNHAMAAFISQRVKLRFFNHIDLFCSIQYVRPAYRFRRYLIDEELSVVEQYCNAVEKIHLRCGETVWNIRPADMQFGGPGRTDRDFFHGLGRDFRVRAEDLCERVDRRVIAATAWIGFKANV